MPVSAFSGDEAGCGVALKRAGVVVLVVGALFAFGLVLFNVREVDVRVCGIKASASRNVAYNVRTTDGKFHIDSTTFSDGDEKLRRKLTEGGVYRFNYKYIQFILGRELRGADPISEGRPDLVCPS